MIVIQNRKIGIFLFLIKIQEINVAVRKNFLNGNFTWNDPKCKKKFIKFNK